MKWVSVKERFPEDDTPVIIHTDGQYSPLYDYAYWDTKFMKWQSLSTDGCCRDGELNCDQVLHWTEIEPPKDIE